MNLEVAQIFLDDVRHSHSQCGRKILRRHRLLFCGILQQLNKAVCETLCVPGREKIDGKFFAQRHLAEIREIGANNRYSIRARQMGDAAASSGRRIGHHRDCGILKALRKRFFRDVAAEFYLRITGALELHRVRVASRLRMISASDN